MASAEAMGVDGGVRRGAPRDDHVAELGRGLYGAGRADADGLLHPVELKELVYVDRKGRLAHSGALNRYLFSFICTGKTIHTTDLVITYRVFKEFFSDEFRPERIPGEEDGFGDLAGFCSDMGTHGSSLISFSIILGNCDFGK
jgi:hypothetical protein